MFENAKLSRPTLSVDVVHDGRHKLRSDRPLDRESIPIIVNLPDEGIAFFTYTWVNAASEAGAAIAIFGPGVGDNPIQVRLADRKVPEDMDFSDWQIESFAMKQDLKFGHAEVSWQGDGAAISFEFDGFHPPYAYSANAEGCPTYCADDRIEQSGRAKGTLTIGDRVIPFDTTGHRDHSWGTRDWVAFQNYRWFEGQVGTDCSVHFWHLHALGSTKLYGYVFKDGLMAEITDIAFTWEHDEQFKAKKLDAMLTDEAGRSTAVKAEFYGHYDLIPHPDLVLSESAGRAWVDGREGVGWMEVAWQTAYRDHVRSIPLYAQAAGKPQ
ncbi:MAG: hypothetical protein RLY97_270 [Pseudomonadota bacterium]|jgi:hypothetical protein